MLTIRKEQLAPFQQLALYDFAARLVKHLLTHYPSPSAALGGPPAVEAFVWRTMDQADGFGIQSTGGVTAFAELLIQFGENFERSPIREWTANILAHPTLPGSAKVETIRERHQEQTQGRVLIPH